MKYEIEFKMIDIKDLSKIQKIKIVQKDIFNTKIEQIIDMADEYCKEKMEQVHIVEKAGMQFYRGSLCDREVVIVKCGVGKVHAAMCTQAMIDLFPVDGIVIVTSPQELVQMIVKKAYNMAGMMHIPVLGVVENYSYFECPDCGKRIALFGESHVDEVAKELGIDVLGKLPLDPKYAQAADEGRFYELENPHLEAGVEKIGNI